MPPELIGSDFAAFLTEKQGSAFPIQLNPTIHLSKPMISFISQFLYTNLKTRERLRYWIAGSCFSFRIAAELNSDNSYLINSFLLSEDKVKCNFVVSCKFLYDYLCVMSLPNALIIAMSVIINRGLH